jgi:EmrB/QacA subfamily drug resistance transporter
MSPGGTVTPNTEAAPVAGYENKNIVLAAMIFAVAMTFIDQTIVAIAAPEIQKELHLSSTGLQWVINGYLVSLAALFALGGRLSDVLGHRKLLVVGVIVFAGASTLNGLTPSGDAAEAWIIVFRIVQGAGAALMYPAALAIVVNAFPLRERGRAMAVFFGIAGGLTAVGPIAGGYLSEWTWRAIFWVNVPVALIALALTAIAKPTDTSARAPIDWMGAVLVAAGMGLSVLGLQQASAWGWGSAATIGTIAGGLVVLIAFVAYERRAASPLIRITIFRNRAFAVENVVLFLSMAVFIPVFFFASMYAQISLGWSASSAGLYLLIFFAGFAPAAQVGGRILDKVGAKPAVVLGCVVAAVGFAFWAARMTELSENAQWIAIIIAGAGMGLMVGPANTDAVNRAPRTSYGEATGITQTVRNYGSSLGLAVLGTILLVQNRTHIEDSLERAGLSKERADDVARSLQGSGDGDRSEFSAKAGRRAEQIFEAVQRDFAQSTRVVFYVMAVVMAAAALVALVALPGGRQESVVDADALDDASA